MKGLQQVVSAIESLNEHVGRAVSWLATLLVAVVVYDVFTRYFLQSSMVWVQELEWHLFALMFLLGAAYTYKHDKHVRVDVLYTRFSVKQKAWVNFAGNILFLLPFSFLIMWTSWDFVLNSFMIGETSPDPGGLPARYILKAAIPVGFFLLFLQGVAVLIKSGLILFGTTNAGEEQERA